MSVATPVITGRSGATGLSGKERLLAVMQKKANKNGYIGMTTDQLARECGLSDHEVVHFIREGLARQNLVRYRESARGLYSIKLTPIAMGKGYTKASVKTPWFKKMFGDNPPQEIMDTLIDSSGTTRKRNKAVKAAPAPEPTISENLENSSPENFPLIEAIANRRNTLDAMAKMAEQIGADDIALTIMERIEIPLTPFESEAVSLLEAYRNCKG